MVIQTDLSMKDFTKYFEANRVGRLYFPNGKCFTPNGQAFENGEITPFHVNLRDLYKLVTGWKVNQTEVPLDDILTVIAFGSAVKHPSSEEVSVMKKRYTLFGPREDTGRKKQVPIQPNDADFLVITGQDLIREKVLEPVSLETYDCGTWIKEGGIHLVNRGTNQVINGVQGKDTVSMPSGLKYIVIKEDKKGVIAASGTKVTLHYSGFFKDGKLFDSSVERGQPFSVTLGKGQVIKALEEGSGSHQK